MFTVLLPGRCGQQLCLLYCATAGLQSTAAFVVEHYIWGNGRNKRQERGAFEIWRNDEGIPTSKYVPATAGRRQRRGVFLVDRAMLPRMLPGRHGVSGRKSGERFVAHEQRVGHTVYFHLIIRWVGFRWVC